MNNNSTPNDNDRNAAVIGDEQSDALSAFATADVVSYPSVGASIDNGGLEAIQVPSTDGARVVLIRNRQGRRGSSIL